MTLIRDMTAADPAYIIAEIGINHNGDLNIAKRLCEVAAVAGCQAVKFQKRTVDVVYSEEELDKPRESPWGTTTREQKDGLEFSMDDYAEIDRHCKFLGIEWFASCWDKASVDEIETFNPPAYKIASACLTDKSLLAYTAMTDKPLIISTGMSTWDDVIDALATVRQVAGTVKAVLQCTSTYPAKAAELNLRCITTGLVSEYFLPGYSGHEQGLATTIAAVALGAKVIERHITLDRTMYGSDQAASLEPNGLRRLVRDIREVELALGDGEKCVYDSELPIREKLRRCLPA